MNREVICYAIVYVAEAIIAWLYYSRLFERKSTFGTAITAFVLGYSLLFALSRLDILIVNAFSFFVINSVVSVIFFKCTTKIAVLQAAVLTLINAVTEIFVVLIVAKILGIDQSAFAGDFTVLVTLSVLTKTLYFLVTFFIANHLSPYSRQDKAPKITLFLLIVPVISVFIITAFIYIVVSVQVSGFLEIVIATSALAFLFLNLAVISIYNHIQVIVSKNMDLQITAMREDADSEYYKSLQSQYDSQRVLIHDIKNHFDVISNLAEHSENERIMDYISTLEELPVFKRTVRFCDNPILNIILFRHAEYCSKKGINFSCDIRSDSVSFLEATSITALFGNLLSNAVEAAEQSAEKTIEISVIKNKSQRYVLVSVINSCDQAPMTDIDGKLVTRKKKSAGHGYGMRSIDRVIRQYQGSSKMYYDEDARQYHIIIQFPLDAADL